MTTLFATGDGTWLTDGAERERLAFLHGLDLLDTDPEPHFDWLTARAAQTCGTPIALLTVIDEDRQWFKSRVGLDLPETPRSWAFCEHAFDVEGPLVVDDARRDDRFADNPAVIEHGICFYAGVSVRVEGRPLGALCVLDTEPRELSSGQLEELAALAGQAELLLELVHRRKQARRRQHVAEDADARRREHRALAAIHDLFDRIVHGAPLEDTLSRLAQITEDRFPGLRCSIMARGRAGASNSGGEQAPGQRSWPVELHDGTVAAEVVVHGPPDALSALRSSDALLGIRRVAAVAIDHSTARAALEHAANHDEVTGVLNRRYLHQQLAQMLDGSDEAGTIGAVLVGIDHSGYAVEAMAHEARNELLRAVAVRLRSSVAADDLVASFTGEQFVVCHRGVASRQQLDELVRRLRAALAAPFTCGGVEVFLHLSVGVADSTGCRDADELLARAAAAMWQARAAGGDRHEWFDEALRQRATRRLQLEAALRHAIGRAELTVHYQPKVRLLDDVVVGAEALVRWSSPDHGDVAADEVIAVAEGSGLIHALGRQVLRHACGDAAAWRRARPEMDATVAVNVSAAQLHEPGFPAVVADALAESGLDPARLCLELTETSVMQDVAAATEVLGELKELGVVLAIDDFGTGYSSLAYLKDFPIDQVKIDRAFVSDLDRNPDDRHIVAAIVAVAAALRLEVVAEGVETQAQLDGLVELGCAVAQGHLWAPAVGFDEFLTLLTPPVGANRRSLPWSLRPARRS